jgi:hypothetical protein
VGNSPWKDGKYPYGSMSGNSPKLKATRAATASRVKASRAKAAKKASGDDGCLVAALALAAGGAVLIGSAGYATVRLVTAVFS